MRPRDSLHRAPLTPALQHQRGVALIIALVLVALAAILATKLTYDSWLERRRTTSVIAVEQAFHFGLGAEALAADVLTRLQQTSGLPGQSSAGQAAASQPAPSAPSPAGQGNQVTLAQPWAQPTQPLPITPENDPEGAPIGTLQGALEDMQGRFNLNTLGHVIAGGQANSGFGLSSPTGVGGIQDPVPLQIFQRLLVSVGLEAKWAGIARDWLDQDTQPGEPDGAEDSVYTQQNPPYRTGNWPMLSPSELMNMPGFGAERYRKIAPFVTALPSAMTQINVCTAPPQVLEALAENLGGEFVNNQALTAGRRLGCFPDLPTLQNMMGANAAKMSAWLGTNSVYFRLTTQVTLGSTDFTLYSLLKVGNTRVTPLLRTFGTY
jgi:general secretion pathway protein K